MAKFPTVANWTGTLTPGANNIIGYDNDVRVTLMEGHSCKTGNVRYGGTSKTQN